MIYEDFHLRVAPDGPEGFQVQARFREQRAIEPFSLPSDLRLLGIIPEKACAGTTRDIATAGIRTEHADSPEEMGSLLFQSLLSGEVGRLFESVKGGAAEDPERSLRLRLHFPPLERRSWHLQSLPWELLYCVGDRRFLALSRRMPIVRSLDTARPLRVLPATSPLRVLITMANPRKTSPLNLPAERKKIEEALSGIDQIQITVLERVTLRDLRLRLREGGFHIVHFMGHGIGFDQESSEGAILLNSPTGEAMPLSATGLAELFEGLEAPRLLVLNACKTAVTPESVDPVRSVAASLVVAGLPAVLAQSAAIQDAAALILAEELYRRLAQGDPIEAALTEARLALRSERRGTSDWAIPALFVRPNTPGALPLPEEVSAREMAPSPPVPEPVAPEAPPGFVQNIKAGQVGKQRIIQGGTVHYHEESGGE